MTSYEFETYCQEAARELTDLNDRCQLEFGISTWPRWHYDLDEGTLLFLKDDIPKIRAQIQVVGSTSKVSNTWLWGWANSSLPAPVTRHVLAVREFGRAEGVPQLSEPSLPDDECLGWELTAVTARALGAKGAYRCPYDNGFLYVVYTDIDLAKEEEGAEQHPKDLIDCGTHKQGFQTFICAHLAEKPRQQWFSSDPTEDDPWPDAWCKLCNEVFEEQGEWNDQNSDRMKAKLACHYCYESARANAES